ncbi:MAG: hypothetical protein Q3986_05420 [Akkermansia sp.]|nr:hypothetical protein [Akkermansia sp.]
MTYTLIPKLWYTITPETDCDIDTPNGISIHLPAGIQYFHFADCVSIDISGTATVTQNPPLFKPASASALGGGFIESNLNVGHGASAAVAAQCTLTLGDLAAGGTLADSNGQSVELADPRKYAEGYLAFRNATEACTLAIGDWSKSWDEKKDAKASGTFRLMGCEETISVSGIGVPIPDDPSDEIAWNAAFTTSGCGIVCTAVDQHGEIDVSVEAAEVGEAGNGIVVSVENYEPVTLAGGSTARTRQEVADAIASDAECPVNATLDADEAAISLTAKEFGEDYDVNAEGDMFSNWTDVEGGHGDYSVAELVTAIESGFDDITPTAGETEDTITLTAAEAGADANGITYTATGCFGSGTVKQGSATRGKNAVTQTDYEIILNGNQPRPLTPTTAMKNGGVYTVAADATAQVYTAITIADNATAEIWLTCTSDDNSVALPSDSEGWIWLDPMPEMVAGKTYAVAARNVGGAVIARPVYEYSTPAQS